MSGLTFAKLVEAKRILDASLPKPKGDDLLYIMTDRGPVMMSRDELAKFTKTRKEQP